MNFQDKSRTGEPLSFRTKEYSAINPRVLAHVPFGVKRVLDIGCGAGAFGGALKARLQCEVVGVTYSDAEALQAKRNIDHVVLQDLNTNPMINVAGDFDCIVCSHVLEHLYRPNVLLEAIKPILRPDGQLIVALPNLLVFRSRLNLMLGRFRYTDYGIMDRTHFRFFDWTTAQELLESAGFRVELKRGTGGFPGSRFIPLIAPFLNRTAVSIMPGLFAWEILMVARR